MFDRIRYLRVMRFFMGTFASLLWWDVLLRQVPVVKDFAARSALQRWCNVASRFRRLAIEMGGVLIKLGQFLSIRVDVLPPEVTQQLAGLQDEVPAEQLADVLAVVTEEFGRPVDEVFSWFAPTPTAAASLAQVHEARLANGQSVVVKIQRPRIQVLVETDLAAIGVAIRWLKLYHPIASRVNVDLFFEEFSSTTQSELDFHAEGKNAERFAEDFHDDPGVVVPGIYWDYTTRRVLTMENVAAIKITDFDALQKAGIDRSRVASRLYHIYLQQVFTTNFVHVDPHPGNLFVRPVTTGDDTGDGRESQALSSDSAGSTPFQIAFVDFGMVATIPVRLRNHLRDFLIGMSTRDSHRLVQAYVGAGVLLPGADLRRLEDVYDVLFERYKDIKLGELRHIAMEEAEFFWREYRDIIYEMPFQFPADVLFVGRAIGILSGIATSLNPDFDPWAETLPFAERLASQEIASNWREWLGEIGEMAQLLLRLPGNMDRFLTQAERGRLQVQAGLAPDASRMLRKLERSVDRLTWGLVFASLLISGVVLRVNEGSSPLSFALLAGASLAILIGLLRR